MKKKSALGLGMMGGLEVTMTPWAGVGVLIEAMRQTEVSSKADKVLPLKRSSKGLASGQMLECFVLLSTLGGDCLEDMERLRQDDALPHMLGYAIPAPETARQWLDRFHEEESMKRRSLQGCFLPPESGLLAGLGEVNSHVVRAYVQNVKVGKKVTLDIDAHLVETDKAEARYCYDGYKAFQPLAVCWAETGLVLRDEFRDGNVPASMDNKRLVNEAYEALPVGDWEVWVRSDSAAYEQENLDHWDSRGWRFAVSADMSPQLRGAIESVPEANWEVIEEKGGVRREWAEVDYVPSRKKEKKDAKPFRYVAVRLSRQQGELFGDGVSVRHFAVVSNIWDMGGKVLLEWHRACEPCDKGRVRWWGIPEWEAWGECGMAETTSDNAQSSAVDEGGGFARGVCQSGAEAVEVWGIHLSWAGGTPCTQGGTKGAEEGMGEPARGSQRPGDGTKPACNLRLLSGNWESEWRRKAPRDKFALERAEMASESD